MSYVSETDNTGEEHDRSRFRAASCVGKERFASRAAAAKVVKRILRRAVSKRYRGARQPSEKLVSYQCEFCGSWHIGRWGSKR